MWLKHNYIAKDASVSHRRGFILNQLIYGLILENNVYSESTLFNYLPNQMCLLKWQPRALFYWSFRNIWVQVGGSWCWVWCPKLWEWKFIVTFWHLKTYPVMESNTGLWFRGQKCLLLSHTVSYAVILKCKG